MVLKSHMGLQQSRFFCFLPVIIGHTFMFILKRVNLLMKKDTVISQVMYDHVYFPVSQEMYQ